MSRGFWWVKGSKSLDWWFGLGRKVVAMEGNRAQERHQIKQRPRGIPCRHVALCPTPPKSASAATLNHRQPYLYLSQRIIRGYT
jgi:hypothetical protein